MLARAVTKAWQDSLNGPPSIGRVHQPKSVDRALSTSSIGWCRPETSDVIDRVANDDGGGQSEVDIEERDQIVPEVAPQITPQIIPKRRGVQPVATASDSLWTSYEFWMGIVVGAAIVFVIKTILAVQAPLGVYWY